MITRLLPAVVAIAALAGPVFADPVDDLVRGYMDASHIPGVAVAVIEDGQITKLQGYGQANLEWDSPVTPDTPFQTASASKIVAGVVLMRLVEKGLVSLDDSISKYFPEAPEAWAPITVRHLAGHMSGIPDGLGMPNTATTREVVAEAMKRPLAYEPGSQSRYGLTDFVVMTAIMEQASGLSYADLVRREVSEPLGLTQTGFTMLFQRDPVRTSEIMPGRAAVYGWRDGVQREEYALYPIHAYAAGGLHSSARDFATLMLALEEGRLLEPESFALLKTPTKLNDGRDGPFGVGWTFGRYHGLVTVGHTGGPALADVMHVPAERLTVISLTNQRRFYPLLSQAIADLELPPVSPTNAITDGDPALTARLRNVLSEAAAGRLEPSTFTESGQRGAIPFYQDFGQAMLLAVGPIQSIELIGEGVTPAGEARRRYRIAFERRTLEFIVRSDDQDRFSEIRPLSGDAD